MEQDAPSFEHLLAYDTRPTDIFIAVMFLVV